jgi:hypothetical protein
MILRKTLCCGGLVAAAMLLLPLFAQPSQAQETPAAKAQAPANQAILRSGLGGTYFVAKPLKQRYDGLVKEVRVLEAAINKGTIDENDALAEIRNLQDELAKTREALEKQKVFVPAAKVHTRTETTTFELGKERLLLIVAGKVRVVGWDGPQVKCVLEKTVLGVGDQSVDDQIKAIKVVHQHRRAPEKVGNTREQWEADFRKQDAAPGAKPPSAKTQEFRRTIMEQSLAQNALFSPLQAKEIDAVEIEGLTHEQGNRYMSLEVESPGGEGSHGGDWQRHASLTVYVPYAPPCRTVAVLGGRGGLDVQSLELESSLVIRGEGSRDYSGQFRIVGLAGSVTAQDIPIEVLEHVLGDVSIRLTAYGEDSGTRYESDMRTLYTVPPGKYVYKNIVGNVRARFCRADLHLEGIAGAIDVDNEFGDTLLVAREDLSLPLARSIRFPTGYAMTHAALLAKAHRIVSESGHVEVHLAEKAKRPDGLPLLALTECGTIRTIGAGDALENVSFEAASGDPQGNRRSWRGFASKGKDGSASRALLERFGRPAAILAGKDRSAGLDLVSRSGSIRIVYGQ